MWQFLGLPKPTALQYDMAAHLQHGPKRDIIQAFRGAAKSWITGAYVLWRLYCNPHLLILVVSASGNRAAKFTTFLLDVIRRWTLLAHLRPKPFQRQSTLGFDVGPVAESPNQQPSVEAKGITGQVTGGRADIIVADDVEIPNNSDTETKREKLRETIREFDAIIRPDGPAEIKYLGTPQSSSTIYNTLLSRGYSTTIWPVRYPTLDALNTTWGSKIAPSIRTAVERNPQLAGKSVEPKRFSEEDLNSRRLSYGALGFGLQFMLDTSVADSDRFPLRLRDLIVMDCGDPEMGPERVVWAGSKEYRLEDLPHFGMEGDHFHRPMFISKEMVPWQFSILVIDPSGRGKDETSYVVLRFLNGRLFLTALGGFKGGYEDEVLEALGKIASNHKVNLVVTEDNFGLGMFGQLLTPHLKCPLETVRVNTAKELRIITSVEPVMSSHRLVVDRSVLERDYQVFNAEDDREELISEEGKSYFSLTYQMAHLRNEKRCLPHDDRIDALGLAVKFYEDRMDMDTGLLEIASAEARIEFDVQQFFDGIFEDSGHVVFGQGKEGIHSLRVPNSHFNQSIIARDTRR